MPCSSQWAVRLCSASGSPEKTSEAGPLIAASERRRLGVERGARSALGGGRPRASRPCRRSSSSPWRARATSSAASSARGRRRCGRRRSLPGSGRPRAAGCTPQLPERAPGRPSPRRGRAGRCRGDRASALGVPARTSAATNRRRGRAPLRRPPSGPRRRLTASSSSRPMPATGRPGRGRGRRAGWSGGRCPWRDAGCLLALGERARASRALLASCPTPPPVARRALWSWRGSRRGLGAPALGCPRGGRGGARPSLAGRARSLPRG